MKQEIIRISYGSMEDVKDSVFTTMNDVIEPFEYARKYYKGRDKTVHSLMLNTHSPLNGYHITVTAKVEDTTHTHLRTHSTMSNIYFCGSSRGDLDYGEVLIDADGTKFRYVKFKVDLKRFIEISMSRLCPTASDCTRKFWEMLRTEVCKEIPEMEVHSHKPCVRTGVCVEGRKNCGYTESRKFSMERGRFLMLAEALRETKNKDGKVVENGKWKLWRDNFGEGK